MAIETKPIVEILDQKAEAQRQALIAVKERLDFHQTLIYGVLVVVGIGFVAVIIAVFDIFVQYKRFDADKYSEFTKALSQQNNQIVTERNVQLQSQVEQMKVEIDKLWKNKYPIRR